VNSDWGTTRPPNVELQVKTVRIPSLVIRHRLALMTSALVLGGGGVAGIAWEAGIIDGLRRADTDLGIADLIVGTSAGSVVGTALRQDADLELFIRTRAGLPRSRHTSDMDAAARGFAVLADTSLDPDEARRRVGKLALDAPTGPEEPWVEAISAGLPGREWPPGRLLITAVNTLTGEFAAWGHDSGVPLDRAIAASCAVPCVAPPVTVDGARYMDGGVTSSTNADLARGASSVVVLDPIASLRPRGRLQAELAATGAGDTMVIEPDEAAVASFGTNLISTSIWLPAFAAGRDQARRLRKLGVTSTAPSPASSGAKCGDAASAGTSDAPDEPATHHRGDV
jgi:NTE family protein